MLSRPTRARGLKLEDFANLSLKSDVAPHAGAWIETVPLREHEIEIAMSRPTRARGLKPDLIRRKANEKVGRAPRGRVD